jgi:hypothetical protein
VLTVVALVIALAILVSLTAFQISLAAGAPLGRFAWGGQHRVLPANLRRSSVIAVLLYGVFALILLERSGAINLVRSTADSTFINNTLMDSTFIDSTLAEHIVAWVLVAYLVLATVMNLASKSRSEKVVMTPVSAGLLVCAVVIALS